MTSFLMGAAPSPYVVQKYREAHGAHLGLNAQDRFERLLLSLVRRPGPLRRPAAAYARAFAPKGAVQAKLIVLLAILESCSPTHVVIDAPPRRGAVSLALGVAARGLVWLVALVAGTLLLHPVRWWWRRRSEG
ncbi:MAG: hypothetical protein WEB90_04595 [Gemmatimonadota bacterium]